ncbi:MAG: hypothetical protein HOP19_06795, partial [Acidobacteria bacterium]|nr:hypothetical protein [Acidobacteriota bacterium]
MHKTIFCTLWLVGLAFIAVWQNAAGQGRGGVTTPEMRERRNAVEAELQSIAVVERKLMIPMRDDKRMAADLYRPKDTSKKYPTVFSRTPYN